MMFCPIVNFSLLLVSVEATAMLHRLTKVTIVPKKIWKKVFQPESIISLHSRSGWLARAVQER